MILRPKVQRSLPTWCNYLLGDPSACAAQDDKLDDPRAGLWVGASIIGRLCRLLLQLISVFPRNDQIIEKEERSWGLGRGKSCQGLPAVGADGIRCVRLESGKDTDSKDCKRMEARAELTLEASNLGRVYFLDNI